MWFYFFFSCTKSTTTRNGRNFWTIYSPSCRSAVSLFSNIKIWMATANGKCLPLLVAVNKMCNSEQMPCHWLCDTFNGRELVTHANSQRAFNCVCVWVCILLFFQKNVETNENTHLRNIRLIFCRSNCMAIGRERKTHGTASSFVFPFVCFAPFMNRLCASVRAPPPS